MRTEMANLPGKCLRERRRQFKLSAGTPAQDFFFFYCYVHKCRNTCCSSNSTSTKCFRGTLAVIKLSSIWLHLRREQSLSTPVFVGTLSIMPHISER